MTADVTVTTTVVTIGSAESSVPRASGRAGDVWNPATGEVRARVGFASAEEVDHAVAAAKRAFPEWRATPFRAVPKSCSSCAS